MCWASRKCGRAVGPGAEVGAARGAQALLEDAADLPVLRVDVDDAGVAEMADLLHHLVHGAVVDAGARARPGGSASCGSRRPGFMPRVCRYSLKEVTPCSSAYSRDLLGLLVGLQHVGEVGVDRRRRPRSPRVAEGNDSWNETTSSACTTSLNGSVPMRVPGAWMPQVVTPAQAAARISVLHVVHEAARSSRGAPRSRRSRAARSCPWRRWFAWRAAACRRGRGRRSCRRRPRPRPRAPRRRSPPDRRRA